jgi:hypothetical protein
MLKFKQELLKSSVNLNLRLIIAIYHDFLPAIYELSIRKYLRIGLFLAKKMNVLIPNDKTLICMHLLFCSTDKKILPLYSTKKSLINAISTSLSTA